MKNSFLIFVLILSFLPVFNILAQPFSNPIPIPYTVSGDTIDLTVQEALHNFDPEGTVTSVDIDTAIFTNCYNATGNNGMSYLGPTIVWKKGQSVQMNVQNTLSSDSTTMHWHGLNIPSHVDGGPHQAFAAGSSWHPYFPIIDSVQTLWYHSHLMDFTTEQVILGQSAMIIIEDPINDPYRQLLPRDYGKNDFPVVIQEKRFTYDTIDNTLKATGLFVSEKPGNGPFTLINGVVNGSLSVPDEVIRLRFLNGSPRKAFHLGFSEKLSNPQGADFETIYQFATDGGYMAQTHPIDSFLLAVGERREMLVDLTDFEHGDTVYLSNLIRSVPRDVISGSRNPQEQTPGDAFMAFVVDTSIHPEDPITEIPTQLQPYSVDTSDIFRHRTKRFMGMSGSGQMWTIDGQPMDRGRLNDTVLVNSKEKWTIINTTDISHPFHIHKVQFQIIEYIGNAGVDTGNQLHYTYPNLPYYMMGYKDDLLIRPGATLSFVADFDRFPDAEIKATNGYMYHCHILTHEDFSMMHQFTVVDSATYFGTTATDEVAEPVPFSVYPNPAVDEITLEAFETGPVRLRFFDLNGQLLKEKQWLSFSGMNSVSVADIPRGMILMEWTSEKGRFVRKIVLGR